MIQWFHFVRHADIPSFQAKGWAVSGPLPGGHAEWSCLMIWTGEGEP